MDWWLLRAIWTPSVERSDWSAILATAPRDVLNGLAWRVVESQEDVATMALVDSLEEQGVLEALLEQSKPPNRESTGHRHYLLTTPFRYPPLPWGSRFGTQLEPSLYYASLTIPTALAESAFYRFVFWRGMDVPPPSGRLFTQHTIFSAKFQCKPGIALEMPPFDRHSEILTDRLDYKHCRLLGAELRADNLQGFTYVSARCPGGGLNVALITPEALASRTPEESQNWLCETRGDHVTFKGPHDTHKFPIDVFIQSGE